jgi:hypothetical protein
MWHVIATICILGLTNVELACFPNAYFLNGYKTEEHCREIAKGMVALIGEDFRNRNITATFYCTNQRPLTLPPVWEEDKYEPNDTKDNKQVEGLGRV